MIKVVYSPLAMDRTAPLVGEAARAMFAYAVTQHRKSLGQRATPSGLHVDFEEREAVDGFHRAVQQIRYFGTLTGSVSEGRGNPGVSGAG